MGAMTFFTEGSGADVRQAFSEARERAAWEHGHGGYTGTLAEKSEYVVVQDKPLAGSEAVELGGKLIDQRDPRIDDKWGPAGAIAIGEGDTITGWLFFGWASS